MTKKVTKWTMVVDGDATGANRAFQSVGKSVGGLGGKVAKIGGLIASAFSVAKIVQFGREAVNAMMEDQKSAAILAKTLQNVTKARKSDIDAVEAFIKKTSLATGVADDDMRPAFARLVRSTKDITKAQKLLSLGMEISRATGKDLGTVANALSKAYDGNFASLTRLGLSLDKSLIKGKDADKVFAYLDKTFRGTLDASSKTFAVRMQILKNAFAEMKEDVGYALLPALEKLAGWMSGTGMDALRAFFAALTGKGIGENPDRDPNARVADWNSGTKSLESAAASLGASLNGLFTSIGQLFAVFGDGTSAQSGFTKFVEMISDLVDDVNDLVQALTSATNTLKTFNNAAGGRPGNASLSSLKGYAKWGPLGSTYAFLAGLIKGKRAIGGTVNPGTSYLVGEKGPELFSPTSSGFITPNGALGGGAGGAVNVTVNVHGNVIRERDLASSVRDQIAQLMRRRGLDPSILGV